MSRTFVEALKEKYCDDDSENQENFVVDIVFSNRPRRTSDSSTDDVVLGYLTNMVLSNASINSAGIPPAGLCSLCPNVRDLDLSSNSISDWDQVVSIFHHLPALKFVNLCGNPLGGPNQDIATLCKDQTFGINDLVLNKTQVSWDQVLALGHHLPNLHEIHLCQNGFEDIAAHTDRLCERLTALKCLRLNGNNISRWDSIVKLGYLPELHTLILSDNPLINISPATTDTKGCMECTEPCPVGDKEESTAGPEEGKSEDPLQRSLDAASATTSKKDESSIEENQSDSESDKLLTKVVSGSASAQEDDRKTGNVQSSVEACAIDNTCDDAITMENVKEEDDEDDKTRPFQSLSVLCVSNTKICSWDDIEALRTFPKLTSLKIRDIPLEKDSVEEDKRRLLIASLPDVSVLNGSEVTPTDTDKSERHFVRYFSDKPDPPKRYRELVQKHGELKSYNVVDIGRNFTEYAHLLFIYGGRCIHQDKVCVLDPVGSLKKMCSKLVRKSPMKVSHLRFLKLYYLDKNRDDRNGEAELEELKLESLPMSRYDMMDGDEIHIDVSAKPQRHGAALLLQQGPVTPR